MLLSAGMKSSRRSQWRLDPDLHADTPALTAFFFLSDGLGSPRAPMAVAKPGSEIVSWGRNQLGMRLFLAAWRAGGGARAPISPACL